MRQTDTSTGVGTSAVGPGMKIGFIEHLVVMEKLRRY